jgi:hypothetical protein
MVRLQQVCFWRSGPAGRGVCGASHCRAVRWGESEIAGFCCFDRLAWDARAGTPSAGAADSEAAPYISWRFEDTSS